MYLTQSDPVSHEDVLMNTKKDLLALFIASQKSQEDLNYQFAIRIPSILESVYMILRKKWVPSEKYWIQLVRRNKKLYDERYSCQLVLF